MTLRRPPNKPIHQVQEPWQVECESVGRARQRWAFLTPIRHGYPLTTFTDN